MASYEQDIKRAEQVKAVLENPYFIEAFDELKASAIAIWERTMIDETDKRESAWLTIRLLDQLKRQMIIHLETGKIARCELENPSWIDKLKTVWK